MPSHLDFLIASKKKIGIIDPVTAATVATSIFDFASNIFGKDNVPNYPIKSGNTYNKLIGIVNNMVPGPPTSVAHAKELLAKAEAARLQETYGDGGAANRTIIMMYDEVITALKNYIAAGGGVYTPVAPGSALPQTNTNTLPPSTPYKRNFLTETGLLGLPNWVTLGGAAFGIYLLTRKKRRA